MPTESTNWAKQLGSEVKKVSSKRRRMEEATAKLKGAHERLKGLSKRAGALNKATDHDSGKVKMGLKRKLTAKQVMSGGGKDYKKYKRLAEGAGLKAGPENQWRSVRKRLGAK